MNNPPKDKLPPNSIMSAVSARSGVPGSGYTMVAIGLLLAIAFWLLESVIHVTVLQGAPFELVPGDPHELWMRALVCGLFVAFGVYAGAVVARLEHGRTEREILEGRLEAALTRALSGFLPICAHCKRVRDERENWIQIESYVRDNTAAQFSHSICPKCLEEHYPGDHPEVG